MSALTIPPTEKVIALLSCFALIWNLVGYSIPVYAQSAGSPYAPPGSSTGNPVTGANNGAPSSSGPSGQSGSPGSSSSSNSTLNSSGGDESYDRLCGPIMRAAEAHRAAHPRPPGSNREGGSGGQKLFFVVSLDDDLDPPEGYNPMLFQYCRAAKSADNTFYVQLATTILWAVVSGVCIIACAYPAATGVCTGFSVGAGVAEALVTSNLAAATSSLASLGASLATSAATGSGSAGNAGNQAAANAARRAQACMTMAMAVIMTAVKTYQAIKTKESVAENLHNAAMLKSETTAAVQTNNAGATNGINVSGFGGGGSRSGPTTGSQAGNGPGQSSGVPQPRGNPQASAAPCQQATGSGDFAAIASCAQAADPNGTPQGDPHAMRQQLEQSHPGLVDALTRAPSVTAAQNEALTQIATAAGGPAAGEQFNQALTAAQAQVNAVMQQGPGPASSSRPDSEYALNLSRGGGGRSGAKSGGMSDTINSLLARLKNPNGTHKGAPANPNSQSFAGGHGGRQPAHAEADRISQNRDFSLFMRITQRYQLLQPQLRPPAHAAPLNY